MSPTAPASSPLRLPPGSRVAVVGGGISGLAAAHHLRELASDLDVRLFESSSRVGGILQTEFHQGYLLEQSADSFITTLPAGVSLCERLGLADELIPTNAAGRRALVVRAGRVLPVPEAFVLMSPHRVWPVITSPVISWRGKLRLAFERFVPPRKEPGDESVASFVSRRLGREAFERLVQPLVAGIYTADPDRLSMQATMPQFVEQERQYGSLWRAARHRSLGDDTASGARYGKFVALRQGMQQLVAAIEAALPEGTIHLNSPLERITPHEGGRWQLQFPSAEPELFDAVIVATPSPVASRLLEDCDADLARELAEIPYAGASIVLLGVKREQVTRQAEGFGFVVPRIENRKIIAVSFSNQKFPGRAPDDRMLLRVFVGGALQPQLAQLDDSELTKLVTDELADLIGLKGTPELVKIARWPHSMPQYHVGHLERVARIDELVARWPGLALAGNAYRGVGVPQCIASGEGAARRVVEYVAMRN